MQGSDRVSLTLTTTLAAACGRAVSVGGSGAVGEPPHLHLAGRGDSSLDCWEQGRENQTVHLLRAGVPWVALLLDEGNGGERKPPSCSAMTCCSWGIVWFCQHCAQTCQAFLVAMGIRIILFLDTLV